VGADGFDFLCCFWFRIDFQHRAAIQGTAIRLVSGVERECTIRTDWCFSCRYT